MGFFRSLAGDVRLELTSADVAGALQTINEYGIAIKQVQIDGDLTAQFTVAGRFASEIENMAVRKGARLKILQKEGVFWPFWGLRRRPILVFGMVLLLALSFWTPSRVFFVRVEGNASVPEQLILEAARDVGICFGASRRAVRSEKMKNAMLASVPALRWAGVNTYGCIAVISVREREEEVQKEELYAVSDIVASCDGVITSCTVTSGSGLCSAGQVVKKGQVLITGYVDCGRMISANRARGEVFAETNHNLQALTPSERLRRGPIRQQHINYSLQLGKKRINFVKDSGIYDASCVKMYSKYCLSLPGGFELPVALICETVLTCDLQMQTRSMEQCSVQLSEFTKDYLRDAMVALTIVDAQEQVTEEGNCYRLTGRYACTEMVGRERGEQIGDFHGKTD